MDNDEFCEEENLNEGFWEEPIASCGFWFPLNDEHAIPEELSGLDIQPGSWPTTSSPSDPAPWTSARLPDHGLFENIPSKASNQDLWTLLTPGRCILGQVSSISAPAISNFGRNGALFSMPEPCESLGGNDVCKDSILLGQGASYSLEACFHDFPMISETTSESSTSTLRSWVPEDVNEMGYLDEHGNWRCRHSGCLSDKFFMRACDLRKHFRSHQKMYFCDEMACPSTGIGFSSLKDYQRHMRSHKPVIPCLDAGCKRLFGRNDNMKDHFRKIHQPSQNNLFPRPCRRRFIRVKKSS